MTFSAPGSQSTFVVLLLLLTLPTLDATAQSYSHTSRPFIQDASSVASGDAGVALPSTFGAFFLNPAHSAVGAPEGTSVQAFGASIGFTNNSRRQWDLFSTHLRPAITEGYDNLSEEKQDEILDSVNHSFREETIVSVGGVLPQIVHRTSGMAFGLGMATHSTGRYQIRNAGAEVPFVTGIARADIMGMGHASTDLSAFNGPPLSLGLTIKHTHRYATSKSKPLDAFGKEEDMYLMEGASTSVDVGALYEMGVLWSGTFYAGAALFDLTRSSFDFSFRKNVTGRRQVNIAQKKEELSFLSSQLEHGPSFRIGAGQVWGRPHDPSLSIAIDYLGYTAPLKPQSHLAHVRLGLQARVFPFVWVQGGLNQGYPTAGVHLSAGVVQLNYAFYGVEEGRIPGQLSSWNHMAQIAFAW